MRVPGAARSILDDARLAAVLNWMLATYGAGTLAPGFPPYTAAEVGAARNRPLGAAKTERARLIAQLRERGLVEPDQDGLGIAAETRG